VVTRSDRGFKTGGVPTFDPDLRRQVSAAMCRPYCTGEMIPSLPEFSNLNDFWKSDFYLRMLSRILRMYISAVSRLDACSPEGFNKRMPTWNEYVKPLKDRA